MSCLQAKNPLLQCSTRLLAVVIENGNAPVEHELPRAIRDTTDCAGLVIHDEVKPYAQGLRYDLDTNIDQGLQTLDLQDRTFTDKFKVVYEVVMPGFQAFVKGLREQINVALEYDRKQELSELSLAAMRASQTFAQGVLETCNVLLQQVPHLVVHNDADKHDGAGVTQHHLCVVAPATVKGCRGG